LSEEIFGTALEDMPSDKIFIATKINSWGEVVVRQSVENSLRRLRRTHLDLVQIHGTSYSPELAQKLLTKNGMVEQLIRLKEEGLIRGVGFTSEDQNEAVYQFYKIGIL